MNNTPPGPSPQGWHRVESAFRCWKEFQLREVRGVKQPQAQTPDALAIGLLFHAARARWFTLRFATDEEAWKSVKASVEEESTRQQLPISLGAEQKALRYIQEYVEHWSKRPRPKPVATEFDLGPVPLGDAVGEAFNRTARVDDVSDYPEAGGLCVGEAKSTSTSVADCVNQYALHGQPLHYLALWRAAPQGMLLHGPVKGIMLDVMKKGYGKEKSTFARELIRVPEDTLAWFIKNLNAHLAVAAKIDWNSDVPRNITSCTRMIGRMRVPCEFRALCAHGRAASTNYVLKNGESLLTYRSDNEGREVPPWI